jgi:ABC-type dipeptide/oligopeptide/nickel transport system ATPase subunit
MLYLYFCRRSEEEVIIQDGHIKAMEKMDLGFNGIYMELAAKKKMKSRVILDGSIRGRARPGRMLAIMGPSGGKLTVISLLALLAQLLSLSVNEN